MTLTVYNDVILPARIVEASGLQGRNIRVNDRARAANGQISVNVRQSRTLRHFEFGGVPMDVAIWQTLEGLFEVTDAGAYGFLMEDPKDIAVAAAAGLMYPYASGLVGAIGLGYGVPTLKLYKRYTAIGSTRTRDRRITRPRAAGITLLRAGSPITLGASAGNAALDADTGTLTFVADASQAISSITTGASTTFNFASGTPIVAALAVAQRVYVAGVSGTAASALNGLSHAVASKGATSLTVSTSTSGLSGTGGTASKFPQASEAMTWSGLMYVPVHFANDVLDWTLRRAGQAEATRLFSGPSIVLDEVPES